MKLSALSFLVKLCETEDLVSKINMAYDRKAEYEQRVRGARVQAIIPLPRFCA